MNLFNAARKNEQGYLFRKMKARDIEPILDIIEAHDEDDAAEAAYALSGDLSGYFVVEVDGAVAGCTGYSRIPEAPTSAWLSETYVHESLRKRGVGSFMMEELRFSLMKTKVERVFISTGDYEEDGVDIYADAKRFYERQGAQRELIIDDFYSRGEACYFYRLTLEESAFHNSTSEGDADVIFTGADVLPESETGFSLFWQEAVNIPENNQEQLNALVGECKGQGAHAIFASLPTPLSSRAAPRLEGAGLKRIGEITDYYGAGVHDTYWARYFGQ